MSSNNPTTIQRISRERLSSILLNPSTSSSVAVIDVRDDDYKGGHIHSSVNIRSTSLDGKLAEVTKDLADKEIVVFHCSLSKQRGPGAALKYLRERDGEAGDGDGEGTEECGGDNKSGTKGDGELLLEKAGKREEEVEVESKDGGAGRDGNLEKKKKKKQEVYVLDGGFGKWQEVYV